MLRGEVYRFKLPRASGMNSTVTATAWWSRPTSSFPARWRLSLRLLPVPARRRSDPRSISAVERLVRSSNTSERSMRHGSVTGAATSVPRNSGVSTRRSPPSSASPDRPGPRDQPHRIPPRPSHRARAIGASRATACQSRDNPSGELERRPAEVRGGSLLSWPLVRSAAPSMEPDTPAFDRQVASTSPVRSSSGT